MAPYLPGRNGSGADAAGWLIVTLFTVAVVCSIGTIGSCLFFVIVALSTGGH